MFIILFTSSVDSFSQFSQEWIREYNGPGNGNDEAADHCTDDKGNVYVTGSSLGVGSGLDIYLSKYSPAGNFIWEVRYNGSGNNADIPHALCVDNTGNVIVSGESTEQGTGRDITTLKYNSSGNLIWERSINGNRSSDDRGADVHADDSGNIFVLGTVSDSISFFDFLTAKFSPSGALLWSRTYNGPVNGNDLASSMSADRAGNIIVTGSSLGAGTINDFVTIKYDINGNELWVRRYNGPANGNDNFTFVAADDSGNVAVTGSSVGTGTGLDFATLKYSPSGELLWLARYTGPSNSVFDEPKAICTDSDGNIFVTGSSIGQNTSYDFAVVKYSSAGTEQWVKRYNGIGNNSFDEPRSICSDDLGNVFVAGLSGSSTVSDDVVVIRYDTDGEQTWLLRYNSPSNGIDAANTVTHNKSSGVIISGSFNSGVNGNNLMVMKYSLMTSVVSHAEILSGNYRLHQNFPNPFNPNTVIRYSVPRLFTGNGKLITLNIYDISGKLMSTLMNETQSSGDHEVVFSSEGIPSGVYFSVLSADEAVVDVLKMTCIK